MLYKEKNFISNYLNSVKKSLFLVKVLIISLKSSLIYRNILIKMNPIQQKKAIFVHQKKLFVVLTILPINIAKHMNLKKLFLLMMVIGLTSATFAQKIYLEGGYFNPKRVGPSTGDTYFDAVRLGALYEYDWKYNVSFQTGLLYNIGYSNRVQRFTTPSDSVRYQTWNHSLEIPLRAVYSVTLFKTIRLFGFAGPNIQIGLLQNQQVDANLSQALIDLTGIQSGNYNLYGSAPLDKNLHRINLQLGLGGGVQWRQYLLKSGYDWGVNNLDRTKSDYLTQGNWYVSFAYQIK